MSKKHRTSNTKQRSRSAARQRKSRIRWWWMVGGLFTIIVLGLVIVSVVRMLDNQAGAEDPQVQTSFPLEISVEDAYQKYQAGVYFLDVREQDEWDTIHVPDTHHIPLGELQMRLDEIPTDQPIVVICNSGNRSQLGRDLLLDAGIQQVTSVIGGTTAWNARNYPVVEGTP